MSHLRFSLTSQTCYLLHKSGWLCRSVESMLLLLCVCVCVPVKRYAPLLQPQWWSYSCVFTPAAERGSSRCVMLVLLSVFLTLPTVLTASLDSQFSCCEQPPNQNVERKQNPLCSCSTNITTESWSDISGHTGKNLSQFLSLCCSWGFCGHKRSSASTGNILY